ncbi:thiol-disulfide oxidoreductase DCC family protein [Flaviaesturariibacter amylovorans]|uniref:Thiol-disulfide oxidoreductase DCC family protein n=1 Tax=Flaviaesturariibacter amylovorans TaxID=1084520 RepID=A0ABP8GKT2_9BACT
MEHPVVLFDGVCNYCNGMVNRTIRLDKKGRIRFAPLQSAAGQRLLKEHRLSTENFNSFVLIDGGKTYTKSGAAIRLLRYLPWWLQEARVLWVVPRPFRDAIYDFIAQNRYKWFGKMDQCMIPTPEVRARFLE